jgi:hypothetical protein
MASSSLAAVNSNGVRQEVIDRVELFRRVQEEEVPTTDPPWLSSLFCGPIHQRDAEYIVECLEVLLRQQRIIERNDLSLCNEKFSHDAIDVFCRFLRKTECLLHSLYLATLPPRQARSLLEALHTNRSVKKLVICNLQDDDAALWIADLLRCKTDFTSLYFSFFRFPLMQILPLLRGQPSLKSLGLCDCCSRLFNDPESTQLFVDNVLLSPRNNTLEKLMLSGCGVSLENRPLMAGFHKNTTIVELPRFFETAARPFLAPILRRNRNLRRVDAMLGERNVAMTALAVGAVVGYEMVEPSTPPPCGLWPAVMAKVGEQIGNNSLGATPVYAILRSLLATWIVPM